MKCCNVSYGGRDGKWGKPNTDHRIVIDFELLLQLIEFEKKRVGRPRLSWYLEALHEYWDYITSTVDRSLSRIPRTPVVRRR